MLRLKTVPVDRMAMFDIDPFLELALTMLLMNDKKNKCTHDVND